MTYRRRRDMDQDARNDLAEKVMGLFPVGNPNVLESEKAMAMNLACSLIREETSSADRTRARREKLRAEGKCIRCGQPAGGFANCAECRAGDRERLKRKSKRRH